MKPFLSSNFKSSFMKNHSISYRDKLPLSSILRSSFFCLRRNDAIAIALLLLCTSTNATACDEFGVQQRNLQTPFGKVISISCHATRPQGITWQIANTKSNTLQSCTANPNRYKLKNGTHLLTYHLSGTAHQEAYLMFDFTDINNQIQSFSYTTKIK